MKNYMEIDQGIDDFIREDESDFGSPDEPVRLCAGCGELLYTYDDNALAIVSEDGRNIYMYCEKCIGDAADIIDDILDAAGIWHDTGWADEVFAAANTECFRRMQNGNTPKHRTLTIQKGVRA